ncbi:MAG: glutaminase, partial [Pseudomonadota bacterium]
MSVKPITPPHPLPAPDAIAAAVKAAHTTAMTCSGGRNADYIPFLAKVPPDLCGVAVVTRQGAVFEAGDSRAEFAIESISKVFTLALVTDA